MNLLETILGAEEARVPGRAAGAARHSESNAKRQITRRHSAKHLPRISLLITYQPLICTAAMCVCVCV